MPHGISGDEVVVLMLANYYLVYHDTPDYLLEVQVWSGCISITVATPQSLHCLQSGADIRQRPVAAGITWYDLNLWGAI